VDINDSTFKEQIRHSQFNVPTSVDINTITTKVKQKRRKKRMSMIGANFIAVGAALGILYVGIGDLVSPNLHSPSTLAKSNTRQMASNIPNMISSSTVSNGYVTFLLNTTNINIKSDGLHAKSTLPSTPLEVRFPVPRGATLVSNIRDAKILEPQLAEWQSIPYKKAGFAEVDVPLSQNAAYTWYTNELKKNMSLLGSDKVNNLNIIHFIGGKFPFSEEGFIKLRSIDTHHTRLTFEISEMVAPIRWKNSFLNTVPISASIVEANKRTIKITDKASLEKLSNILNSLKAAPLINTFAQQITKKMTLTFPNGSTIVVTVDQNQPMVVTMLKGKIIYTLSDPGSLFYKWFTNIQG